MMGVSGELLVVCCLSVPDNWFKYNHGGPEETGMFASFYFYIVASQPTKAPVVLAYFMYSFTRLRLASTIA